MAERPRIVLLPTSSPLEWPILPLIEEWADVAVVRGAWIEDGQTPRDVTREMDVRGWDRATVVSDEWAIVKTVELADARPDVFERVAIGHACVEISTQGEQPSLSPEVVDGYQRLMKTNYQMFARALTQTTRGDYDDELVKRFMEDSNHEDVLTMFKRIRALEGQSFEPALRKLDVPMLIVRHSECLLWTPESFDAAKSAFPDAQTAVTREKCSTSPDFVEVLRDFCLQPLPAAQP